MKKITITTDETRVNDNTILFNGNSTIENIINENNKKDLIIEFEPGEYILDKILTISEINNIHFKSFGATIKTDYNIIFSLCKNFRFDGFKFIFNNTHLEILDSGEQTLLPEVDKGFTSNLTNVKNIPESFLIIKNCIFYDAYEENTGRILWINNSVGIIVENCVFQNKKRIYTLYHYGAISVDNSKIVYVLKNYFFNTTGVDARYSSMIITRNNTMENSGSIGGDTVETGRRINAVVNIYMSNIIDFSNNIISNSSGIYLRDSKDYKFSLNVLSNIEILELRNNKRNEIQGNRIVGVKKSSSFEGKYSFNVILNGRGGNFYNETYCNVIDNMGGTGTENNITNVSRGGLT